MNTTTALILSIAATAFAFLCAAILIFVLPQLGHPVIPYSILTTYSVVG